MQFHPDTHHAAIIWERHNNAVGMIPMTVVSLLSQALFLGFDAHTAVIETEHHPIHSSLVMAMRLRND